MLNLAGLVLGFLGALLLLIDPSNKIAKDHLDSYIKDKKSIVTIPTYSDQERRELIRQVWFRRTGLGMLAAGFGLQLIHQATQLIGGF